MLRRLLLAGNSGAPPAGTIWDATAKGIEITLSGGGLVASTGASTQWRSVLATVGKSTGKWQFEVVCLTASGSTFAGVSDRGAGLAKVLSNYLGYPLAAPESIGHWGSGRIYFYLSSGKGDVSAPTYGASDVITVALDADAGSVSFYKNGVLAGTRALPAGVMWYPGASLQNGGSAQLRTTALVYPVGGYADWA